MRILGTAMLVWLLGTGALVAPAHSEGMHEFNSVESICTEFAGQPMAEARGRTVILSCEMVRTMADGLSRILTVGPGHQLAQLIRSDANTTFDTILKGEPSLNAVCRREFSFSQRVYYCPIEPGLSMRFFLSSDGTIANVEERLDASHPYIQNSLKAVAASVQIDRFTSQFVALYLQMTAMTWRKGAVAGETYTSDGLSLFVLVAR